MNYFRKIIFTVLLVLVFRYWQGYSMEDDGDEWHSVLTDSEKK